MDLIFSRYSSPFLLLDNLIDSCSFSQFIDDLVEKRNSEQSDKYDWEYYLHRVFDKSFNDFRDENKRQMQQTEQTKKEKETTVNHSLSILNNFNPLEDSEGSE